MIQVKHLTKQYTTASQSVVTAANDLSFTLPARGMVFLLGKSGCGKRSC